jgi:hypothetical protein
MMLCSPPKGHFLAMLLPPHSQCYLLIGSPKSTETRTTITYKIEHSSSVHITKDNIRTMKVTIAVAATTVILLVLGGTTEARQTFNIDMQHFSGAQCRDAIGKSEHVVGNGKCHTFDRPFTAYQWGWSAYDWIWDKLEKYG